MATTKKASKKRRVEFVLRAAPGSEVYLGGSFNAWSYKKKPLRDKSDEGVFRAICMVSPGIHEYKFHVNGSWCVDPENPSFCQNEFGTLNSVLEVH